MGGADVIMIVYDITKWWSFRHLDYWLKMARKKNREFYGKKSDMCLYYIIGTKADRKHRRRVTMK